MVCPSTVAGVYGAVAAPRYVMYFDQYHPTPIPNNTMTAGITHVITAFANSSIFTTDPVGNYTPFMPLADIRPSFDTGTKLCMAIGGWGDTEGFRLGAATDESISLYASNIAATLDRLGYECVDMDWEYPGGNGYDYKQVPNEGLTSEIESFPKLLKAIKEAIGDKELSLAAPGLTRDMIAYTAESIPLIDAAIDFFNLMSYDLFNRRDTETLHHTSVAGSLAAVQTYLDLGLTASKINLGIAFYAKYAELAANSTCAGPIGCATALLEAADGSDTGKSGAFTFEASNFVEVPTNLTESTDGACGAAVFSTCPASDSCCSAYGYCGNTEAHCGTGCQSDYGTGCTNAGAVTTVESFHNALANGTVDTENGGAWYIDPATNLFWTWDTPELVTQKFTDIVAAKGLGGIMAWSLVEDSHNGQLMAAMQKGVKAMTTTTARKTRRNTRQRS